MFSLKKLRWFAIVAVGVFIALGWQVSDDAVAYGASAVAVDGLRCCRLSYRRA